MTRTLLICHHDAPLDLRVLTRWLCSWSTLAGVVVITEGAERKRKRVRRELKRVGAIRFADVLAFRTYYRARLAKSDSEWEAETARVLEARYADCDPAPEIHHTASPNAKETATFIRELGVDIAIARCKFILKREVFSEPRIGTFVLHPGICPEYRNAHGGFWALAEDDTGNVGTTLLQIDEGVDTGPVYGYFTYDYDEVGESHIVIQQRTLFDNLDEVADRFGEIAAGTATAIDTSGRDSNTWGQPWLSKYLQWKAKARKRKAAR